MAVVAAVGKPAEAGIKLVGRPAAEVAPAVVFCAGSGPNHLRAH